SVGSGRGQPAVPTESQPAHAAAMPGQIEQLLTRFRIPYTDLSPLPGRNESSIRAECHPQDGSGVAVQRVQTLSGARIPDRHRVVLTGGRQKPAIRAERHAKYPGRVSAKDVRGQPGGDVPETNDAIGSAGGDGAAVWTEGHTGHR